MMFLKIYKPPWHINIWYSSHVMCPQDIHGISRSWLSELGFCFHFLLFLLLLSSFLCTLPQDSRLRHAPALKASQHPTQRADLLDSRVARCHSGALCTCCGSRWRSINRVHQWQTDPRDIPGIWHSEMRTRQSRTDNHSRHNIIFYSIFIVMSQHVHFPPSFTFFFITRVVIGTRVHAQSQVM